MNAWGRLAVCGVVTTCAWAAAAVGAQVGAGPALRVHSARRALDDLEIRGEIAGLAKGSAGYLSHEDLARLPQTRATVDDDPDFPGVTMRVSGVSLETLARALRASARADLVIAWCSDRYAAHYPREMIETHHPLLVLTIDEMTPHDWARKAPREDPGPYLVVYQRFRPAWKVLAHEDKPQLPTNVVALEYAQQSMTFARIAPRGPEAKQENVSEGFRIAQQNCIRCHAEGATGGTKSGETWSDLGRDAHMRPEWFARMIREPAQVDRKATMPGNPDYDSPTVAALTAYFRTFAEER